MKHSAFGAISLAVAFLLKGLDAQEIAGMTVIPHVQSQQLRYRTPPDPRLGARIELFLTNNTSNPIFWKDDRAVTFDGLPYKRLLESKTWTWCDFPRFDETEMSWMPGELTVFEWNSSADDWGVDTEHSLRLVNNPFSLSIQHPVVWISAITFLSAKSWFEEDKDEAIRDANHDELYPDRLVAFIQNESNHRLWIRGVRLWLPSSFENPITFVAGEWMRPMPSYAVQHGVGPLSKGRISLRTGKLPLTYAVIEIEMADEGGATYSLWARQRIKRESFEIGGGWVAAELRDGNALQKIPYLKTLRRLHISSGMHQDVAGYTDTDLYDRYPLKYMNRLEPLTEYDRDEMLARIHAVEFLGEPQYGGGRPVPPQEVFDKLLPYRASRLPTSVTHSEERIWRYYSGLSDYPHFDAYRVTAPAADAWRLYDRWGGVQLRWGAPLETIGVMTRSLRELNRPRPIAYWSQGAHYDWGGVFGFAGRSRTSPTPDELRSQAFHGLANRITSLYWFNLSLKSLVKFRDLIGPIQRVNREIRLIEPFLLEGDSFSYDRLESEGAPQWDLVTIATEDTLLCFVLDLGYRPDPVKKVFEFLDRKAKHVFLLPESVRGEIDVFRVDSEGVHSVNFRRLSDGHRAIEIEHDTRVLGIYVATSNPTLRERLERRHRTLVEFEASFQFNPAEDDADFEQLRALLR